MAEKTEYAVSYSAGEVTAPHQPNTVVVPMDVILDIERRLAELTTAVHGLR